MYGGRAYVSRAYMVGLYTRRLPYGCRGRCIAPRRLRILFFFFHFSRGSLDAGSEYISFGMY